MPSVEERVQGYVDSGYFEHYGHIFHQMLVPHPLLLHLEKASLVHTCFMEQQDPPDQLHFLLQIMALVLLEL